MLGSSSSAVLNAFFVALIGIFVFAVLGVHSFSSQDPEHFKTFAKAVLTLFQVATLDGWAEITRGLFGESGSMGDRSVMLVCTHIHMLMYASA